MNVLKTALRDVLIIEPQVYGDHRGWFMETYSQLKLKNHGIDVTFVQDNQSFSAKKGTLRGLHFQNNPMAQSKLLRCIRGAIMDVAVDIRLGSPCYKEWIAVELSEANKRQLFIPKGFAHGFLTLTDDVEVQYKVDAYYAQDCDRGIAYNDPSIGVDWGSIMPILSDKDKKAPLLDDSDADFFFK